MVSASPIHLSLEGVNTFSDAVESVALARFVSGEQPYVEEFEASRLERIADIVPIGSILYQVTGSRWQRVVATGDGWTAMVKRWTDGSASVAISAVDKERLAKVVAEVRSRCPVSEPSPTSVNVDFWFESGRCFKKKTRRIEVPRWQDIAGHYSAGVEQTLSELMSIDEPVDSGGGRLLLWHGPPGTGKTTAIRALAKSWEPWCRALFVVDPEKFFGTASYLLNVLLEVDDDEEECDDDRSGRPRWRLLVIEDADELVRGDAKRESGQSLSRLLNVADGIVGQGVNVLVLITTNEPLGRLHPAVARPGRCLADVEFGPLSATEAALLLGMDGLAPSSPMTLAEVFERRGDSKRVSTPTAAEPSGFYL